MKTSIYFLSSNDSIRSQIAVGYAKKYLPDWDIQSAGVRASQLDKMAVEVMATDNIDISDQTSKVVDQTFMEQATIIVTLCGEARDKCLIPHNSRWLHWENIDPDLISDDHTEKLRAYQEIRDNIKHNIIKLAALINEPQ